MGTRLERIVRWIAAVVGVFVRASAGTVRAVTDRLPLLYHVAVVILSAAVASTLPFTLAFVAEQLLGYWSVIRDERVFLVATEVGVALLLVFLFNHARANWTNRRLSRMARAAGMIHQSPGNGVLSRRSARRLKERHALMRDIMIIGSTGFRTFVDPRGDLHTAIENCRTAKIMLLDPESAGAFARARTIGEPEITPDRLRTQVQLTIAYLRTLPAAHQRFRLKLYPEPPLWKLVILGDYAWVRHYHPTLDVRLLPEYVFAHRQDVEGLYTAFYQYFATRWNDPAIPEYDLMTGELILREGAWRETGRALPGGGPR